MVKRFTKEVKKAIKTLLSNSLWSIFQYVMLSHQLQHILQQNEENTEALIEYGIIMFDNGKRVDALRVFLKLLIMKPDDKMVRSNLAKVIKGGNGVDLVVKELKEAPSIAPALVFLATVIKDYGGSYLILSH